MSVSQPKQVNITGSFVNLPEIPCNRVSILNTSAASMDVRRSDDQADASEQITIPAGLSVALLVQAKASELQIKGTVTSLGCQLVCD